MRQLGELEKEAEARRALLAADIDDIRLRIAVGARQLSPAHLARRTTDKWRHWIEQSARENPVQLAGLAALIAYPLWRAARALPLPVVIAGTGVLLAGKARAIAPQAKQLLADSGAIASEASDRLVETTKNASDSAARAAQTISERAADGIGIANQAVAGAAQSAADIAREQLSAAVGTASATASGIVEAMTPSEATIQKVGDTVRNAAETTTNISSDALNAAARFSSRAMTTVSENPLLVAGLGLAAGGILAACLPRTEADRKMLGGAAQSVRGSSRKAVKQAHRAASDAVDTVYERALEEAETRGLTSEALNEAADKVTERVSDTIGIAKRRVRREPTGKGESYE